MSMYDKLEILEKLSSNLDKEAQLKSILTHYNNAEQFFRFTFNDLKYGVQEQTFKNAFSEYQNTHEHISDWFDTTLIYPADITTIKDLIEFGPILMETSGNDQIMKIRAFFDALPPLKKKWFCRAILKDLRCGVQLKTFNKVMKELKKETIEKFSLQLCDKIDIYDDTKVKDKLKFPCSMECKYDGIRVQAEIYQVEEETKVELTSRRGTDKTNDYPEIVAALKEAFDGETLLLDGEVISSSFQELTKKDSNATKKYVIFDLLVDEKLPYKNRWDNLLGILVNKGITDYNGNKNIKYNSLPLAAAEHYSCNNIQELREYYEELNRRKEEGVIIKLDADIYERGTRKHMFKCKKVHSADLLIKGHKTGEGRRSGKVSTLCLIDKSGTIKVDVGSGIDDDTCEILTKEVNEPNGVYDQELGFHLPEFWGKICEIQYNEITETSSIRFPRFICIRDDKTEPDDLSIVEVRQK